MGSKAFLFLGLVLAIFLMIRSEVVARELAETSNLKSDNENEVHVDGLEDYVQHGIGNDGRGGYYGGGGHGHRGGGYKRKGCRYGCCKKYNYVCKRCCSSAGEAMDKVTEAQPQN
ncbi:glycine-rich protein-like isoform X2 [Lycium ferocissimum]|uniref:glycine-rich protein-like isoform X2 n=1 Tax=Lycium ferocissimum TaxID=112874 RepID=UPI002815931A|nr:glycine-rich protein-like isoform X2 [Lycium ferocissimum]